jgi:hypothetical protein
MNVDDKSKRVWQSQFSGRRLVIKDERLLDDLRRQERSFRGWLYATDVGMVLLICVLLGVLGYLLYQCAREPLPQPFAQGAQPSLTWAGLILGVPLAGLAVFITVDRFRFRQRHPKPEDSIRAFARNLLAQINHRIWLFKTVFWWFVLPIVFIADAGFRCYMAWWVGTIAGGTKEAVWTVLRTVLESAVTGVAIFYLFRWLARRHLQSRKQELEAFLQTLEAEDNT